MRAALATTAAVTLTTILLAEPGLARSRAVDADPTEMSYHSHSSRHHRHRYHYRHYPHHRSHSVRVHSDPPGVKWTELPAEPTPPEPTPLPSRIPIIKVHTETLPPTTPLFQSRHLLSPSLPTIAPAQARAYCIDHGLECAGGAAP